MSGRLDAVRAGELLRRQEELQAEAEEVIGDLDLLGVLGRARSVRLIGSSVTGLMVWRYLDLQVLSPGLSAAETWEMVRPLAAHPQVHEVRFLNQAGANSFSGDPRDSGHYFQILYRTIQDDDWKLDVSLSVSAPSGSRPLFQERSFGARRRSAGCWTNGDCSLGRVYSNQWAYPQDVATRREGARCRRKTRCGSRFARTGCSCSTRTWSGIRCACRG
jgi:hypothetical protein